jgi:Family of unknown function (DUF6338)
MPDSVTAVLIALIAVFPGLMGNSVYRSLLGVDWREKEWHSVLRLLGFSVIGIVLYSICAFQFGFLPPAHLFPETYESLQPNQEDLRSVVFPYIGHLAGGIVAGVLGAWGTKLLARVASGSAYPSAWDDFARTYAPRHWVIVSLSSGDVYAGKLKNVDVAVAAGDRDLVLEEPCIFDETVGNYRATNYQYLFIPAAELFSIAAVYDVKLDKRILTVGELLFPEGGPL